MKLRMIAPLLALCIGGCTKVDLGDIPFRCGADGACPQDYICESGVCVRPGAGTPDAGAIGLPAVPECPNLPAECVLLDWSAATGNTSLVATTPWSATAEPGKGVPVLTPSSTCGYVGGHLRSSARSQVSQSFRPPTEVAGRLLAWAEVGPVTFLGAAPTMGSIVLHLDAGTTASVASTTLPATVVRGDAIVLRSDDPLVLNPSTLYHLRVAGDGLPTDGTVELAWDVAEYGRDGCPGTDPDTETHLSACDDTGDCSQALAQDGAHQVYARPRLSVAVSSELSSASGTPRADISGRVRFDLEVNGSLAVSNASFQDLASAWAAGLNMRVAAHFPPAGGSVRCFAVCP